MITNADCPTCGERGAKCTKNVLNIGLAQDGRNFGLDIYFTIPRYAQNLLHAAQTGQLSPEIDLALPLATRMTNLQRENIANVFCRGTNSLNMRARLVPGRYKASRSAVLFTAKVELKVEPTPAESATKGANSSSWQHECHIDTLSWSHCRGSFAGFPCPFSWVMDGHSNP